ncbi:Protein T27D12.1 a [Aphelenchoides avenae]|nr:Protein T27D12.1 a [Aphelenchus avenae]
MGCFRDDKGLKGPFRTRTRFLLLILVTSCLMINWANILTFSFTVICMHNKAPNASAVAHQAPVDDSWWAVKFGWSGDMTEMALTNNEKTVSTIAESSALITNIPIITIINVYGARYVFTAVGYFGALATALIPYSMRLGFNWFLIARMLQGMAFAGDMATFGAFVSTWTYWKQTAFFTSTLCAYVQFAPVFTMPTAGLFCDSSMGWQGLYYYHACVTIVLFTLFYGFYRDDPQRHPLVGTIEKGKIAVGRDADELAMRTHIPYKKILTSPAAWAVFVGSLGNFAGVNFVYMFSPTYLNKVMGYAVVNTGFLAALPPLMMAAMKEFSGLSNDRIHFIGETTKTKVYNSMAFLSEATFFLILSFLPAGYPVAAMVLLTTGTCLLGFNTGGFYKSGSLIARQYAPFVLGQTSTGMTIMILLVPLIVNTITIDNTVEQWSWAFRTIAGIMIACNIFYCFFASGEPCEWAKVQTRKVPTKVYTVPALEDGSEKSKFNGVPMFGNENKVAPTTDEKSPANAFGA